MACNSSPRYAHPVKDKSDSVVSKFRKLSKSTLDDHIHLTHHGNEEGEVFLVRVRNCDYVLYAGWSLSGGRAIIHAADCNNPIHESESSVESYDDENSDSFTLNFDEEY